MPDYTQSCVIDNTGERIDLASLGLPKEYLNSLDAWHLAYKRIIPLSESERLHRPTEIGNLDKQGLQLAEKMQKLVHGGAKVKYFSEGKSRLLS